MLQKSVLIGKAEEANLWNFALWRRKSVKCTSQKCQIKPSECWTEKEVFTSFVSTEWKEMAPPPPPLEGRRCANSQPGQGGVLRAQVASRPGGPGPVPSGEGWMSGEGANGAFHGPEASADWLAPAIPQEVRACHVDPRSDYILLWSLMPFAWGTVWKLTQKLQLFQNAASRQLSGLEAGCVQRELLWLPGGFEAQFQGLVLAFKALKVLGPGCLKDYQHPCCPAPHALPMPSKVRHVALRGGACSVGGTPLWLACTLLPPAKMPPPPRQL